jgi:hypothetical protein
MKITTQKELDQLISTADKSNTIILNEDLEITFDCEIPCNILTKNIISHNIDVLDIKADYIYSHNIDAADINCCKIKARDNIKAWNIDAWSIDAGGHIDYYAFCIAEHGLKCKAIKGSRRKNSIHKCLDQEIEFIK